MNIFLLIKIQNVCLFISNMDHIAVRFSTNEGETWNDFKFSDREVNVYQLLTEPGEKSTVFTIFGSYADQRHSWLILQVNTSDVLGKLESEKQVHMESSHVRDPLIHLSSNNRSQQLFASFYLFGFYTVILHKRSKSRYFFRLAETIVTHRYP